MLAARAREGRYPAAAMASAARGSPPESKPEPSFDERLARLEAIVAELETGGLPLERSLERYQDGVGLLRDCRAQLDQFQKRVEELSAASGTTAPYAADPDAASG